MSPLTLRERLRGMCIVHYALDHSNNNKALSNLLICFRYVKSTEKNTDITSRIPT